MAYNPIFTGTTDNDDTGDAPKPAGVKINAMFQEVYKGNRIVAALTDASTIAVDASLAGLFTVTLGDTVGATRILGNPTNLTAGQSFQIAIRQNATGSRALTYASNWKFPNRIAPVLSTAASSLDILTVTYDGTTLVGVLTKDFG